jgi:hypothetical protein
MRAAVVCWIHSKLRRSGVRDGAQSPARLVERFWQATRYCLPVDERIRRFGETDAQAKADYAAAEQRQAQVGQELDSE